MSSGEVESSSPPQTLPSPSSALPSSPHLLSPFLEAAHGATDEAQAGLGAGTRAADGDALPLAEIPVKDGGIDLTGTESSASTAAADDVSKTLSEVSYASAGTLPTSSVPALLETYLTAGETSEAAADSVEGGVDSPYESAAELSAGEMSSTLRSQSNSISAPAVAFEIDGVSSDGDDSKLIVRTSSGRRARLAMRRGLQEEEEAQGGSSSSDGASPGKEDGEGGSRRSSLSIASLPRRMRQRLEEPKSRSPMSLEAIEAKLSEATSRRQQFRAWLSNKAKPRRSSPLSAVAPDPEARAQRLEAKLSAAEQKRETREMMKQQRHERQEVSRQEARSSAASRLAQRTALLERLAESKAARAELKRQERLEEDRQRWALAHDRLAQMNAQREASAKLDDERLEKFHAALLLKLAAAAQKRLARLEAERTRAGASAAHSRQVAQKVGLAREAQRTVQLESLDAKVISARRRRAEILRTRGGCIGSVHSHSRSRKPHHHLLHGEKLSKKLTRCWRQFQNSRNTTYALAEAFVACQVSAEAIANAPFEVICKAILSPVTLKAVRALLARLETRLLVAQPAAAPPGTAAPGPGTVATCLTEADKPLPPKVTPTRANDVVTSPSRRSGQGSLSLALATASSAPLSAASDADDAYGVSPPTARASNPMRASDTDSTSSLPTGKGSATVLPSLTETCDTSAASPSPGPAPSAVPPSDPPNPNLPKDISYLLRRLKVDSEGHRRAISSLSDRGTSAGGRGRGAGAASRSSLASSARERSSGLPSSAPRGSEQRKHSTAGVQPPSTVANLSDASSTSANPGETLLSAVTAAPTLSSSSSHCQEKQAASGPNPLPSTSSSVPIASSNLVSSASRPGKKPPPTPPGKASTRTGSGPLPSPSKPTRLERYPEKIFLCAYMILTQPDVVFSVRGPREEALAKAGGELIPQFEELVKYILQNHSAAISSPALPSPSAVSVSERPPEAALPRDSAVASTMIATSAVDTATAGASRTSLSHPSTPPVFCPSTSPSPSFSPSALDSSSLPAASPPSLPSTPNGARPLQMYSPSKSLPIPYSAVSEKAPPSLSPSPSPSPFSRSSSLEGRRSVSCSGERRSFASLLAAFDAAWVTYLEKFAAWKMPHAEQMAEDIVGKACQLELSMLAKCGGLTPDTASQSPDVQAIREQTKLDHLKFRNSVSTLTGESGVARLEAALEDVRSRFALSSPSMSPRAMLAAILSPGALLPSSPSSSRTAPSSPFPAPVAPSLPLSAGATPTGALDPPGRLSPRAAPGSPAEDRPHVRRPSSRVGTPPSQRLSNGGTPVQNEGSGRSSQEGSPARAPIRRSLFRFPPFNPPVPDPASASGASGGAGPQSAVTSGERSPAKAPLGSTEKRATSVPSPSGPAVRARAGQLPGANVAPTGEDRSTSGSASLSKGENTDRSRGSNSAAAAASSARASNAALKPAEPPTSGGEGAHSMSNEELLYEMMYDATSRSTGYALLDQKVEETSEQRRRESEDDGAVGLEKALRMVMETAFWDAVAEDLLQGLGARRQEPPRIVALIREFRDEMVALAPARFKDEIEDQLDMEVLGEMFASEAPTAGPLLQLLQYSADLMIRLGAPFRDSAAREEYQKLVEELSAEVTTGQSEAAIRGTLVAGAVKGLRFLFDQWKVLKVDINRSRVNVVYAPMLQGPAGIKYLADCFAERFGLPASSTAAAQQTRGTPPALPSLMGGGSSREGASTTTSTTTSSSSSTVGSNARGTLTKSTSTFQASSFGAEVAKKLPRTRGWLAEVTEKLPEVRSKVDAVLAAAVAAAPEEGVVPDVANLRAGNSRFGGDRGGIGGGGGMGGTGSPTGGGGGGQRVPALQLNGGPLPLAGCTPAGRALGIDWKHLLTAVRLGCVNVVTRPPLTTEELQQAEAALPETLGLDTKRIQKLQRAFDVVLLCATGVLLTRQVLSTKTAAPADVDAALASLKDKILGLCHKDTGLPVVGRIAEGSGVKPAGLIPLLLHRTACIMAEEVNGVITASSSEQHSNDSMSLRPKPDVHPKPGPSFLLTPTSADASFSRPPQRAPVSSPVAPPDLQERMLHLLSKTLTPGDTVLGHLSSSLRLALLSLVLLVPDSSPAFLPPSLPSRASGGTGSQSTAAADSDPSSLPPLVREVASTFLRRGGCAILLPEVLRLARAISRVARVTSQVHEQWYLTLVHVLGEKPEM